MRDQKEPFAKLFSSRNAHERGRSFEELIRSHLSSEGFEVDRNSRAAHPRQTDIYATKRQQSYLWELKWLRKPASIDALSSLKERLRGIPSGIVGVLCSVSGFARQVQEAALQDRSFEILLIDGFEVFRMLDRGFPVEELLERKREAFRRHAKHWFLEAGAMQVFETPQYPLPEENISVASSDATPYVGSAIGENSDIVFTQQSLVSSEYGAAIPELELDLRIIQDVRDLRRLLGLLHRELGFIQTPDFSIRQTDTMWMGVGVEAFLQCALKIDTRNRTLSHHIHHSEELSLFGQCAWGNWGISIRQSTRTDHRLHSGFLTIRFRAIPLSMAPFEAIRKAIHVQQPSLQLTEPKDASVFRFLRDKKIDVVRPIVKTDEYGTTVIGWLIRNPFYRKRPALQKMKWMNGVEMDSHLVRCASAVEFIPCNVKDWYSVGDVVDGTKLLRIEAAQFGDLYLLHFVCTWDRVQERYALQQPFDDFTFARRDSSEMERALMEWRSPRKRASKSSKPAGEES